MSRRRKMANYGSSAISLVDVLANGVAAVLVLITISLATELTAVRAKKTQEKTESTIIARRVANVVARDDIPVSALATLHDYDQCDAKRAAAPELSPAIDLHEDYVLVSTSPERIDRKALLKEQNAVDTFAEHIKARKAAGLRTTIRANVYSIRQYYLALSILIEHGVGMPLDWHFLGENLEEEEERLRTRIVGQPKPHEVAKDERREKASARDASSPKGRDSILMRIFGTVKGKKTRQPVLPPAALPRGPHERRDGIGPKRRQRAERKGAGGDRKGQANAAGVERGGAGERGETAAGSQQQRDEPERRGNSDGSRAQRTSTDRAEIAEGGRNKQGKVRGRGGNGRSQVWKARDSVSKDAPRSGRAAAGGSLAGPHRRVVGGPAQRRDRRTSGGPVQRRDRRTRGDGRRRASRKTRRPADHAGAGSATESDGGSQRLQRIDREQGTDKVTIDGGRSAERPSRPPQLGPEPPMTAFFRTYESGLQISRASPPGRARPGPTKAEKITDNVLHGADNASEVILALLGFRIPRMGLPTTSTGAATTKEKRPVFPPDGVRRQYRTPDPSEIAKIRKQLKPLLQRTLEAKTRSSTASSQALPLPLDIKLVDEVHPDTQIDLLVEGSTVTDIVVRGRPQHAEALPSAAMVTVMVRTSPFPDRGTRALFSKGALFKIVEQDYSGHWQRVVVINPDAGQAHSGYVALQQIEHGWRLSSSLNDVRIDGYGLYPEPPAPEDQLLILLFLYGGALAALVGFALLRRPRTRR